MPRKLGKIQEAMLDSLKRHKRWYYGCGWIWDTDSGTTRILESLVKRGLVYKKEERMGDRVIRTVYRLVED